MKALNKKFRRWSFKNISLSKYKDEVITGLHIRFSLIRFAIHISIAVVNLKKLEEDDD